MSRGHGGEQGGLVEPSRWDAHSQHPGATGTAQLGLHEGSAGGQGDVILQMLTGKHLSSPYGSLSASLGEPQHCHP